MNTCLAPLGCIQPRHLGTQTNWSWILSEPCWQHHVSALESSLCTLASALPTANWLWYIFPWQNSVRLLLIHISISRIASNLFLFSRSGLWYFILDGNRAAEQVPWAAYSSQILWSSIQQSLSSLRGLFVVIVCKCCLKLCVWFLLNTEMKMACCAVLWASNIVVRK